MLTQPPAPAYFDPAALTAFQAALNQLGQGFADLPDFEGLPTDPAALEQVLREVAERLRDNYPYFHPLYAGQMLKPPHPVARLAYMLALWINPNNHALDGGRASSHMEKEAVAQLARMFGWQTHLGHLTSGGTVANLEALWVAGRLRPETTVVASTQAHYTHARISAVLGLPFEPIACDPYGRLDADALEARLRQGGVGTVVATLGATATGAVDPLPRLLVLREQYGFRLHADAAYGGYFGLARTLGSPARAAFDCLGEADSIVVDPHKHGLQPYGCGSVLFRDPTVARFYKHDSPYTYFTSAELHLGEISLECSRAGAAAVALWATLRLFPLEPGGAFAAHLERSRAAALDLQARLEQDTRFVTAFAPELDIVVWAPRAASAAEASRRARAIFAEAARRNLHLALADLPTEFFGSIAPEFAASGDTVTCLRSVLMKAEHADWVDHIYAVLGEAATAALGQPAA
ncbi:MAG: aminotransferase class I/II-fold pyridoxal phosphate-dependent enzyme [Anaerolineales bacterium]|nr:aminotransferase class I/II-fold pyridoxal phosphate-dependent enzyme [Anaerolineales bacterium]